MEKWASLAGKKHDSSLSLSQKRLQRRERPSTIVPFDKPKTHAMSELKLVPEAPPRWVVDLTSPPAPRAKANGIVDPAGFPSQAPSAGKVRACLFFFFLCLPASYAALVLLGCIANPADPGLEQKRDGKDAKAAPAAKKAPTPEEMDTLKVKKAWEVALAPIKSLPMTAIMMYMSGNSLQIFTIMTVFMAFKNPIAGLLATQSTFERFETPSNSGQLLQVKLAYVVMQFVALALGIWKVNAMGLLPYVVSMSLLAFAPSPPKLTRCRTTRSDWLAWEFQPDPLEVAVPAL